MKRSMLALMSLVLISSVAHATSATGWGPTRKAAVTALVHNSGNVKVTGVTLKTLSAGRDTWSGNVTTSHQPTQSSEAGGKLLKVRSQWKATYTR